MVTSGGDLYARLGLVDSSEDAVGFFQQHFAGPRKSRAARGAFEQPYAEVVFQFLDRTRQRRLLDVQSLGSTSEVKFFCDGDETPQMAKLHGAPISRFWFSKFEG